MGGVQGQPQGWWWTGASTVETSTPPACRCDWGDPGSWKEAEVSHAGTEQLSPLPLFYLLPSVAPNRARSQATHSQPPGHGGGERREKEEALEGHTEDTLGDKWPPYSKGALH